MIATDLILWCVMLSPLLALLIIAVLLLVFSVFLLFRENERLERELRSEYRNPDSVKHLETYQQIVEQAQWGIATRSADGQRIERCNKAFAQMHGYELKQMQGMPVSALFASVQNSANKTLLREIHSADHYRFESLHQRRDGSLFPALIDSSVIRDKAGNILFRVLNVLDISDQARSQATLRLTLEKLPVAVWLNDAQGSTVYCNPATEQILGHRLPLNPLQTDFLVRWTESGDVVTSDEWPVLQAARSGKPVLEQMMDFYAEDGQVRTLVLSALPLLSADQTLDGTIVMMQDITSIRKKDAALLDSKHKIRELARHHERMREDERTRIAREIHDELGQHMTALRMDLSMMRMKHAAQNPDLTEDINQMKSAVDESIGVVRSIASDLRPKSLDMGFVPAARWLISTLQKRSDTRYTLETSDENIQLDDTSATTAFRILQESLTNILRHANASRVTISLGSSQQKFSMRVEDNGCGFNTEVALAKHTFGLIGLQERALMLGGKCDIVSTPGSGTKVLLEIPLSEPSELDAGEK